MSEYNPFHLERAFDAYEFREGMQQMSCSDGESLSQADLLALADTQCRQLWDSLTLSYTQVGGHPLLLKELTGDGVYGYSGLTADQVLPAVPQEGILIAMMAICDQIRADNADAGRSDANFEAIVVWPSYQSLHETLRSRGATLKLWILKAASDAEWTFDLADLKELLSDRTRLLVVNFPHNPSGFALTGEAWSELIHLCSDRGIYLFSDEIYNACTPGKQQSLALAPAASLSDRAVSMSGLSKSFGLPGLRLGWLVSRNDHLMRRMRLLKDYTTICLPAPVEILGLIALRNATALVERVRGIVEENIQLASEFFTRHGRLFVWREPLAGTTALVEMLDPLLSKFDGNGGAFCTTMIDRFNVFVVGSDLFQFSGRYFRLGLGRRDLPQALARFEAALGELQLT